MATILTKIYTQTLLIFFCTLHIVYGASLPWPLPETTLQCVNMEPAILNNIDIVVQDALEHHCMPGAVVLVAHKGSIVYHKAFGFCWLEPTKIPMTLDTIFDVASLTKPIVTATLIMKLVETGKISLTAPVSLYISDFAVHEKALITVEQLLTHRSGMAPELPIETFEKGRAEAFKKLYEQKLECPPNTKFIYSCSGYHILGALVENFMGKPLDILAQDYIFKPLHMHHTGFHPIAKCLEPIAPCDRRKGTFICGDVHDPAAFLLGGVSGNAGLFATASDLAIFCQMILNEGIYNGARILSPLSIQRMTTAGSTPAHEARGLGWDINTTQSFPRGDLFPIGSFGHTGFTGVSMWIDQKTKTFVIFLSNRLHPDGKGDVKSVRSKIATIVAAAINEQ